MNKNKNNYKKETSPLLFIHTADKDSNSVQMFGDSKIFIYLFSFK